MSDVTLVFNPSFADEAIHLPATRFEVMRHADRVSRRAAELAPRRTGRLAGSVYADWRGDHAIVTWGPSYGRFTDYVQAHTSHPSHWLERSLYG